MLWRTAGRGAREARPREAWPRWGGVAKGVGAGSRTGNDASDRDFLRSGWIMPFVPPFFVRDKQIYV